MSYVVLDTNVLVSALWTSDGNPALVAHLIPSGSIVPCYCNAILDEYRVVLSRPRFHFSQHQITQLIDNIKKYGKAVVPGKSDMSLPDESDRVFYDTAKECGAILITGNTRHYPLENFIMTPTQFLSFFKDQ